MPKNNLISIRFVTDFFQYSEADMLSPLKDPEFNMDTLNLHSWIEDPMAIKLSALGLTDPLIISFLILPHVILFFCVGATMK